MQRQSMHILEMTLMYCLDRHIKGFLLVLLRPLLSVICMGRRLGIVPTVKR